MTIYSNAGVGATFVSYSDEDEQITENGEKSYVRRGWIRSANISSLPEEGDAYPDDSDYKLRRISSAPKADTPGVHDVMLTYKKSSPNNGASWDTDVVEKDSNTIPIAINVEDPLIPSSLVDQAIAAGNAGNQTIETGGVSYQYTTYVATFAWTAASLLTASTGEVVGETGTPTGITSITADTWMFKGNSVSQKGSTIRVTENWEGRTVPFK